MATEIQRKYIILFAILIALTGFTFESQQSKKENRLDSLTEVSNTIGQANNQVSTLTREFAQP